MKIKHQQQPTATSCVSACIAMLLNIPVEDVMIEFHDLYLAGELNIGQYLISKKANFEYLSSEYRHFQWNNVYLLAVPSLNIKAHLHSIILDTRNNQILIFDPNRDKLNKNYYVNDETKNKTKFEYGLISYCLEYKIHFKNSAK